MTTVIKVREKGIVVLPKELREKAGIKEGSVVVATVFDDGIILSPKESDVLTKLLGLAKVSKRSGSGSVGRIRSLRRKIDKEEQTLSSK